MNIEINRAGFRRLPGLGRGQGDRGGVQVATDAQWSCRRLRTKTVALQILQVEVLADLAGVLVGSSGRIGVEVSTWSTWWPARAGPDRRRGVEVWQFAGVGVLVRNGSDGTKAAGWAERKSASFRPEREREFQALGVRWSLQNLQGGCPDPGRWRPGHGDGEGLHLVNLVAVAGPDRGRACALRIAPGCRWRKGLECVAWSDLWPGAVLVVRRRG